MEWTVRWARDASGSERSATGAGEDWFSEVHAGEVIVVVEDEGEIDGAGTNVVWLVGDSFEDIIVKKSELEVG